jgi:hypothetical protein
MAVYFVTGKLGSGKTLVTVGKIRDALQEGKPVASNLNINLVAMLGRKAKKPVFYRLPDKPSASDLSALGSGNSTYDEEKNGLIVLDECGTWFNARNWQDKGRKELLEWLLHARKLGWDIMFIIQDISMVDKQAKHSVAEHVVYCRRLDRLGIPFLDPLAKLFRKKGLPKPKVHMAIVKYGYEQHSMTVDRWYYTGRDLYPCYDTKQGFRDDYPHSLYQQLPPYFTHGRFSVPLTGKNLMRLTKIHFRRFSKVVLLAAGLFGGAAVAGYFQQPDPSPAPIVQSESLPADSEPQEITAKTNDDEKPQTVSEKFDGFIIKGVAQDKKGNVIFVQISNGEQKQNLQTLRSLGYIVKMVNPCEVLIMNQDRTQTTRLHTSYCSPTNQFSEPTNLTPSLSEQYIQKLRQVSEYP